MMDVLGSLVEAVHDIGEESQLATEQLHHVNSEVVDFTEQCPTSDPAGVRQEVGALNVDRLYELAARAAALSEDLQAAVDEAAARAASLRASLWYVPLFIAKLRARVTERKAYAPGGAAFERCVNEWGAMYKRARV